MIEDFLGCKTSRIETTHIFCVEVIQGEYCSKSEKALAKSGILNLFISKVRDPKLIFFIKQKSRINTSFNLKILAKKHGKEKWLGTCLSNPYEKPCVCPLEVI